MSSAVFVGPYRYSLSRRWDVGPSVTFVMLNPSTADHERDDPTIKSCVRLASSWDFSGIEVVNLFAYRATDPDVLHTVVDKSVKAPAWLRDQEIIGPDNDKYITEAVESTTHVICAWGAVGGHEWPERARDVLKLIPEEKRYVLKLTKGGHPWHPLYIASDTQMLHWDQTVARAV